MRVSRQNSRLNILVVVRWFIFMGGYILNAVHVNDYVGFNIHDQGCLIFKEGD